MDSWLDSHGCLFHRSCLLPYPFAEIVKYDFYGSFPSLAYTACGCPIGRWSLLICYSNEKLFLNENGEKKDGLGPVLVGYTLCHAVHILGT